MSADAAPPPTGPAPGWHARVPPLLVVLLYVLPWWLLVPLLTTLLYQSRLHNDMSALAVEQAEYVDTRSAALTDALIRLVDDIRLVERVARTALQSLPGAAADERLARFFFNLLTAHPHYAQARLLDADCHERVRVDMGADGKPFRVAAENLQDKSDRPYCIETLRLPEGDIYLSSLDANIEFGRVVLPLQPMLRAATPVAHTDGTGPRVVVLNYDASALLDTFGDAERPDAALIDAEGYWLHAPDPADTFGFVTGQADKRLGVRHPALWAHLRHSTRDTGQLRLESGLWTFRRFAQAGASKQLHAPTWYVLSQIPADTLAAVRRKQIAIHLAIAATALLVLTPLSLALALSRLRQQRVGEALAHSNGQLAHSLHQLQQSQDELVRSAKLASLGLMVAGVAHELNTPLGAAMLAGNSLRDQLATLEKAYAEGLRRSDMSRFTTAHAAGLALLRDNLQRAAHLIRQFKNVAADRATATRHRFALADVVGDVLALMRNDLKQFRHRVEVSIPPDIVMDSYPGPLGQIVQNLVSNAVHHAYPNGRIGHIRVEAARQGEQITLSVIDDGRGIPAAERERIWDPFFTTRRHLGGTGLGLHLCQQLAAAVLGGTLTLVSADEGRGTHLRLTVPGRAPDGAADTTPSAA